MRRSPTEEIAEVPKTLPTVAGKRVLLREVGEREAEVRTFPGNDKEAAVAVPVIVGAEVAAKVQKEKTRRVVETERRNERDTTMNGQVDRGRTKEERNMRGLHLAPVTTKVEKTSIVY